MKDGCSSLFGGIRLFGGIKCHLNGAVLIRIKDSNRWGLMQDILSSQDAFARASDIEVNW
jgi:hypothetical protein